MFLNNTYQQNILIIPRQNYFITEGKFNQSISDDKNQYEEYTEVHGFLVGTVWCTDKMKTLMSVVTTTHISATFYVHSGQISDSKDDIIITNSIH